MVHEDLLEWFMERLFEKRGRLSEWENRALPEIMVVFYFFFKFTKLTLKIKISKPTHDLA